MGLSPCPYSRAALEKSLRVLSNPLRRHAATLERKYRTHLAEAGFTPEQRDAFAEITPTAGAMLLTAGKSSVEFLSRVRSAGKLFGLSELHQVRIQAALTEFESLAGPFYLQAETHCTSEIPWDELCWARHCFQTALLVCLNEAFHTIEQGEFSLTSGILEAANHANDPEALFQSLLELMMGHFEAVGGVVLEQAGEGRTILHCSGAAPLDGHQVPPAHTMKMLLEGPRVLKRSRHAEHMFGQGWASTAGDVWSMPFAGGILQLAFGSRRNLYTRESQLLLRIADTTARALKRISHADRLQGILLRLLEVEELERRRIARELHDDAGQSLVVVRLQLELTELALPPEAAEAKASLAEIREITENTILGVRRMISDLSPAVLESLGLNAAIRQMANRFRANHPANVSLNLEDIPELHPRLRLVVYRVLQECFTNITRHSQAKNVNVSLGSTDTSLELSVEDDGIGFVVAEGLGARNCFGLLGVRQRVTLLGGDFHIESKNSKSSPHRMRGSKPGTSVKIRFPLTTVLPE